MFLRGLDKPKMTQFCGADGCAARLLGSMQSLAKCMAMYSHPDDANVEVDTEVEKMDLMINSLCSQNAAGEYCTTSYFQVGDLLESGQKVEACASAKLAGCCVGSFLQMADDSDVAEFKSDCGITEIPKSCPLPGESMETVKVDITATGITLTDETKDQFIGDLRDKFADSIGVDPTSVTIVVDENGGLSAVVTASDTADISTITQSVKDNLSGISDAVSTAAVDSGAAAEGEVTVEVPEDAVNEVSVTNDAPPIEAPPVDDTDGNTDGGNTDGGNTDGGNTDGGNTDGGNTDGGNTDGGNTDIAGGNADTTAATDDVSSSSFLAPLAASLFSALLL
jgi:phenylpyruvate tautomerase PptA (4-oxalocrotonate tautomerase family)